MEVVKSGCQAVPKTDTTGDEFCWRLSFSRGELILSQHIPEKAKLVFLAVKLAWKQGLKHTCCKLKSYHLKRTFYHFLEKADKEALERADVEMIYCLLYFFAPKQTADSSLFYKKC